MRDRLLGAGLVFLISLGAPSILAPSRAWAISTLPCPSIGAQPQSTPSLGAGQDNACEYWSNLPQPLTNANVSGANLSSASLWVSASGANFTGTNFSGAILSSQLFPSGFSGANLTNANLQGAHASYSIFDDAIFTGATLTGIDFQRASLRRVNLSGLDLRTTTWFRTVLDDANLSSANLSGVSLSASIFGPPHTISRANFSNATMVGTTIMGNLVESLFVSANLTQAWLMFNAEDSDFTGAFLFQAQGQAGASFTRGSLRNAVLIDANLSNVRFWGTDLTGAVTGPGTILNTARYDAATIFPSGNTFVGPTWGLFGNLSPSDAGMIAVFDTADFSGLSYANVDFMNASMISTVNVDTVFTNANLSNCNLRFARLEGAILTGAGLASATLTGATYDETTIFPSGSDYSSSPWGLPGGIAPWNAGMIPVPEPSGAGIWLGATVGISAIVRRARAGASPVI